MQSKVYFVHRFEAGHEGGNQRQVEKSDYAFRKRF
jgi:hypothetical protein